MFICQACNAKHYGGQLFSIPSSYGGCEACGKAGNGAYVSSVGLLASKVTVVSLSSISLSGKVILVDMDGVICDFNQHLIQLAVSKLGAPRLSEEQLTNCRTEECFPEEWKSSVSKLSDEARFYEGLDPVSGAAQALAEMEKLGAEVFICATPKKFYNNPYCAGEKHRWVMKHLGREWTERIILTRDKTMVHGDVLIDDKPEVTGILASPSWTHVYYDQPYNRDSKTMPRIASWTKWKEALLPVLGV